jgi:hypothetical protein
LPSQKFTKSALTAFDRLSASQQADVKRALAAVPWPFVTSYDIKSILDEREAST